MEKEKEATQEITRKLKGKRARKYAILAVALVLVISAVSGFSIEGKDAKLADGQGQVVDYAAEQEKTAQDEDQVNGDAVSGEDGDQAQKSGKARDKTPGAETPNSQGGKTSPGKSSASRQPADKNHDGVPDQEQSPKDAAVDNSKDPTASNGGNVNTKPEKAEPVEVTISIYCNTLSEHMEKLENPAIKSYIPSDGVILKKTTYKGTTDNTVFDALNTVCRNSDIQLDFSYTPIYASYYIKGINYLYEFDGGQLSGWMYKVNGWFPNYGCSSYTLKDGDKIVWVYTCDLGNDVGGGMS